jgi:hypothetical protein
MLIPKDTIVGHLHAKGRHDEAIRADAELDDRVHTVKDIEALRQYGIDEGDVDEILSRPPTYD